MKPFISNGENIEVKFQALLDREHNRPWRHSAMEPCSRERIRPGTSRFSFFGKALVFFPLILLGLQKEV